MGQLTHIARSVDPRYPTNLAIIIWCGVVAVVMLGFQLISGVDILQAGMSSISTALTVFVGWAFTREVDPQEQLSAFVPVALITIALFVIDAQFNLQVIFYFMMMSRIVNRSIGLPVKLTDSLFLLIFTGVVGLTGSWIYAMMGAFAFLLDSILPNPDRKHILFAGLSVGIMVVGFVMQNSSLNPTLPTSAYMLSIVVATLIFIPVIVKSKHITVTADMTGEPLTPIRVQAMQVMVLLFGYLIALWQGDGGILEFLPLWLMIAGVGLFPLIKPILPQWDLSREK